MCLSRPKGHLFNYQFNIAQPSILKGAIHISLLKITFKRQILEEVNEM